MLVQNILCMIVLLEDIVYTILHYILIIMDEREITKLNKCKTMQWAETVNLFNNCFFHDMHR